MISYSVYLGCQEKGICFLAQHLLNYILPALKSTIRWSSAKRNWRCKKCSERITHPNLCWRSFFPPVKFTEAFRLFLCKIHQHVLNKSWAHQRTFQEQQSEQTRGSQEAVTSVWWVILRSVSKAAGTAQLVGRRLALLACHSLTHQGDFAPQSWF